jgi:hypothetical protein
MGYRDQIISLANDAVRDPAHAQSYSQAILETIARWRESEGSAAAPTGYLYAGAHNWIARVRRLEVEITPEEAAQPTFAAAQGVPITTSAQEQTVDIRTPFDGFVYAVSGSAVINNDAGQAALVDYEDLFAEGASLNAATESRDLFSCSWGLDGDVNFSTDGHRKLMFPGAVTVGTRLVPRRMAWTLRRNQTINVRFRSMMNVILRRPTPEATLQTIDAQITYHVINLETP